MGMHGFFWRRKKPPTARGWGRTSGRRARMGKQKALRRTNTAGSFLPHPPTIVALPILSHGPWGSCLISAGPGELTFLSESVGVATGSYPPQHRPSGRQSWKNWSRHDQISCGGDALRLQIIWEKRVKLASWDRKGSLVTKTQRRG